MKKVLLIDGDIVAYELSASTQRDYVLPEAGDARVTITDPEEAIRGMREKIDGWVKETKADHAIVCLSDDFSNFRKKVLPTYKGNRKGERPVILYDMKDELARHYEVARWANIEADDVMGILSTEPQTKERRCIVSVDKDLATIPGWLWNPMKMAQPVKISPEDADRFFLRQVLTGDTTDGYSGCPGAGPKLAEEILDGLWLEMTERLITRGPRAGQTEPKLVKTHAPDTCVWDRIEAAYVAKGLSPEDALVQARCAFILRHGYYEDGRVTLWEPSAL